ncbi:hypothetical protein OIE13_29975 [Streptosporangium sp. NBC_01810]|uniref:hypothetical protein n=1 Tax=Streptosporangium sp. NBC_01810 TaxID=2975951 RepID=UPI002DDBA187|nr:hypothetical protein [Streptosporangium sp. NBC_01810]WSA25119.1 hypothetical protein OIE13_29975 [Streptosporangium sp. NBC_01810]
MGYPPQYGQPPRGETGRGLTVIVIMALGVAIGAVITVFMVLNPPSSPPGSAPTPDAEHSEVSVRQAAQPALDAYSSGSYGDFWDLWTTGAQGLITREEYVRLFDLCPQLAADSPFTIATVAITGDSAMVQADRLGDTTEFGFVFESGSWRYEPPPEEQSEYRKPVDQIAEQRQAAGFCGTVTPAPGPSDPAPGPSDPASDPAPGSSDPASDPAPGPSDPASGPSVPGPSSSASSQSSGFLE